MTQKKTVKNQSLIRGRLAPSMTTLTPFVIFKAGQYIEQKFAETFEGVLRARHFAILRVLLKGEARTQQELGETLWIDRGTMTALVKDLLQHKMLVRLSHDDDARSFILSVTAAGRKFCKLHEEAFLRLESEVFENLSAKELETVRAILSKALSSVPQK